jgi:uncharacterized protein (DUF362 family)
MASPTRSLSARSRVAIARDHDKLALLERVADEAGFWAHLEDAIAASGKAPADFVVAIKPNLMIFMTRDVPEVATDPELVEHLVALLRERGLRSIKVVESQNTMGNWVRNRSVANVARVAGFSGDGYELVDLTLERVRHTYRMRGLPAWSNWVGRTWRDADYRIDFSKFKTQVDNNYTLSLKNQFGTLPLQDKYWHYHTRRPYWACTLYTLANFPVHFGFIDAYRASDGAAGFAVQYHPKQLELMLAGQDIVALDLVGAELMGLEPREDSPLARAVLRYLGEPVYEVVGDRTPIAEWENVPEIVHNLVDVGQAIYLLSNLGASAGILNLDVDEFPPRVWPMRFYYKALNTLLLILNGKRLPKAGRRTVTDLARAR